MCMCVCMYISPDVSISNKRLHLPNQRASIVSSWTDRQTATLPPIRFAAQIFRNLWQNSCKTSFGYKKLCYNCTAGAGGRRGRWMAKDKTISAYEQQTAGGGKRQVAEQQNTLTTSQVSASLSKHTHTHAHESTKLKSLHMFECRRRRAGTDIIDK